MTLLCAGTAVQAQSGNGAYVERTDRPHCIGNLLLGLPNTDCVTMTQTVFMALPSGRSRAVWVATLPIERAPASRFVFKYTWDEPFNGVPYHYESVAVAMPDGSLKLTLNADGNP